MGDLVQLIKNNSMKKFQEKEIYVYVASPYTNGWMPSNIKRQFRIGEKLLILGVTPFVPLIYHFLDLYTNFSEKEWLKFDISWLRKCDAVIRIKPLDENDVEIPSPGADGEEAEANKLGIPVFYSISEFIEHFYNDLDPKKLGKYLDMQ